MLSGAKNLHSNASSLKTYVGDVIELILVNKRIYSYI